MKNLASSSCFFAEVLNWFQSLYISKKKPWPIGFLDIISGRYINKVNLLRCFYIVHRKNRERKQPQHPVSYCPTVNDDYFRLCGIPGSLLLTRKYCCHNKNGGIRVFKRAFSKWGNGWVHYIILFSNDVMRQFCKCSWTFWKACFLPKEKNHLLFFYGMLLT